MIDRTGVAGVFDAHLVFAGDSATPVPDSPADGDAQTIFTAVQEELGLRLSPDNGRVEVLVVNRVRQPSEN